MVFIKNSHSMNVSVLKGHYVKKKVPNQTFDCSKNFFKNASKVATPIRKAVSSLCLSLDKHFDQKYSKAYELISLISLITEKILHPEMCHKSLY